MEGDGCRDRGRKVEGEGENKVDERDRKGDGGGEEAGKGEGDREEAGEGDGDREEVVERGRDKEEKEGREKGGGEMEGERGKGRKWARQRRTLTLTYRQYLQTKTQTQHTYGHIHK